LTIELNHILILKECIINLNTANVIVIILVLLHVSTVWTLERVLRAYSTVLPSSYPYNALSTGLMVHKSAQARGS